MRTRRILAALAAFLVPFAGLAAPAPSVAIHHVFVIVLENQGYATTFGAASQAPYLAKTLPGEGALLTQYFGTGHASLDNYLAMISGQAATPETRDDCHVFAEFKLTGMTPDGQAIGQGCVYPASVKTLADQLAQAGLSWKAYMEDMGNDPAREPAACGNPPLDSQDVTRGAERSSPALPAGDQYTAHHNPFIYFHSILDTPDCAARVIRLEQLAADLKSAESTPNFSFIAPNLCHDGHDHPCKAGDEPGGLVSADAFLRKWVPLITASPAFRQDGLLIVTFDESDADRVARGPDGRAQIIYEGATCCNQRPGPNLAPFPQTVEGKNNTDLFRNFGGGRIGAVLLSPFIKPGTVSTVPYNHYSLLKSVEDLFHLSPYLGYAGQDGLAPFGSDIFTGGH